MSTCEQRLSRFARRPKTHGTMTFGNVEYGMMFRFWLDADSADLN